MTERLRKIYFKYVLSFRGVNKCRCQGGHSGDHCQVGRTSWKIIKKTNSVDLQKNLDVVVQGAASHHWSDIG